jgi:hypothetical protein
MIGHLKLINQCKRELFLCGPFDITTGTVLIVWQCRMYGKKMTDDK